MSLLVEKEGILTTVQDLGRSGYRDLGINPGGVMDRTAARLINIILGNNEREAVLEFHFPAGRVKFLQNAVFALGGGDFDARLNSQEIDNWRPHFAASDSELRFAAKRSGTRLYLAVGGGFAIEKWLGSLSTNLVAHAGGFDGRRLRSGDRVAFRERLCGEPPSANYFISPSLVPFYRSFPTVRVVPGAEYETLSTDSRKLFSDSTFVVSKESDRMGYRLLGPALGLGTNLEMLSSAVSFGTIQLLPDGNLIVLMADHQTTGGYPRVANVISHDLPLLGQLGPNDKIAFHVVSIDEAERVSADFEKEINLLKIGSRINNSMNRKM